MIVLIVILWLVIARAAALLDGPPALEGFLPSPYELIPLGDATSIGDGGIASLKERMTTRYGETVALASKSGSRMVVGAPYYSPNKAIFHSGSVFLYDFNDRDNKWDLVWSLTGAAQDERLGRRLSLAGDGSRLAIRRYKPNRVVIYEIETIDQGGRVTYLTELSDNDGYSMKNGDTVTISPDGSTLAVSDESSNGLVGRVTIFRVEADTRRLVWLHTIDGYGKGGQFGWTTSFSETGDRLLISAPNHDGKKGLVRAYKRESNGAYYAHLGQHLVGSSARGQFGFSLMMNKEGTHFVACSPAAGGNGVLRGTVTVWRFSIDEHVWVQVGNSMHGAVDRDRFGGSVSISEDGQTVAVTSYLHDSVRGWAKVFSFVASENTWRVVGAVKGREYNDRLGFGLFGMSMTDDSCRLAVGSVMANGYPTGKVQLYELVNHRSEAPSPSPSIHFEARNDQDHRGPVASSPPSSAPTRPRSATTNPTGDPSFSASVPGDDREAGGYVKHETTSSLFPTQWVILITTAGTVFVC